MYEDNNMKENKTPDQNEEMEAQIEEIVTEEDEMEPDFDECCCDYDSENTCGESKVKKYGFLIFVVVIFLGLFSGIMLRLDRLEDQMAAARKDAATTEATVIEKTKAIDASVAEIKANFDKMQADFETVAKANMAPIKAVEEMKTLYKETDKILRDTLTAKDQLIQQIISNLRIAE